MAAGQHLGGALAGQAAGRRRRRSAWPACSRGGRVPRGPRTRARAGPAPRRTAAGRRRPAPGPGHRAGRRTGPGPRPRCRAARSRAGTAWPCPPPCRAPPRSARARSSGSAGTRPGRSPAYSVSPGRSAVALTRPITSPGKASSTVSRSWPNIDWAYLVANGRPVAAWVSTMPRSNRPEHTRTNAIRSRCAGSMLACTLNTRPENGASTGARLALDVVPRGGRRGELGHRVEQAADAEVRQRRAEQHRARRPGQE